MKEEKAMRMEEKGRKQKRSMKKANLLETINEGSVPRLKRRSEKTERELLQCLTLVIGKSKIKLAPGS